MLSIITVNYNNLKGLEKTFNSIIDQTFKNFEFVVIDGGSTDGSEDFLKVNSNKLDYWISEPDEGVYNAINKGIEASTGDYLLFLNSGDHFFKPNVLEKYIDQLKGFDLFYFNVQVVGDNGSEILEYPAKLKFSHFINGTLCHQAIIFKKELFSLIGLYDENLLIVADWKFLMKALFKYNCSYKKINKTLTTFYYGGMSTKIDSRNEKRKVLEEEFEGFITDYQEYFKQINLLETNRYTLLSEVEKTTVGRKIFSFLLRAYIILFTNKKLKNLLKK